MASPSFNLHLPFTLPHSPSCISHPPTRATLFSCLHALTSCRGFCPNLRVLWRRQSPNIPSFHHLPSPDPSLQFETLILHQKNHCLPIPKTPPHLNDALLHPRPIRSLPSETQDPPTSPEASHPNRQVAPPSQERPPPELESPTFPSKMTASSFSTASESSLKPAPLTLPLPPQQAWKRPRRAFVRHGLGGAGNYHKRPDSSPNSDCPSFLSSLLGTFGNKKRKTRKYPEADSTGCSQYSSQALPLGAAEVLKRKILGQGAGGKTSTSSDRS